MTRLFDLSPEANERIGQRLTAMFDDLRALSARRYGRGWPRFARYVPTRGGRP